MSLFRRFIPLLAICIISFSFACNDSTTKTDTDSDPSDDPNPTFTNELNESLQTIYDDNSLAALSFSAIDDAEVFYTHSLGYADLETATANTTETAFLIASLSKIVTGTAIMQLHEEGKLFIDDPVNDYLPFSVSHPYADNPITIRHLLTHSSTIVDQHYDPLLDDEYTFYGEDPSIELTQMMRDFLQVEGKHYNTSTFIDETPGTYYEYSNLAIALLGSVVEHVTGNSFAAYCQSNIFGPLNMNDTAWLLSNLEETTLAMPYDEFDDPYGHYTFTDYPNGGLRTSIDDFTKLTLAFINSGSYNGTEILSAATVDQMLSVEEGAIFEYDQQGLIFYHEKIGTNSYWGHSGSEKGSATLVVFDPESGDGAIYFSNKDVSDPFFTQMDDVISDVFSYTSD